MVPKNIFVDSLQTSKVIEVKDQENEGPSQ
jgi:hypothetical protein